jgi:hypothetical protein
MRERIDPPPPSATDRIPWMALFGAPLTWFASQQASYALVPWACHGGPLIAIHLVNLAALMLVAMAGALAWRDLRRAGRHLFDELARSEDRARFLGVLSLMLCGLFGLAIIAQMTGAFFFGPYQR